MVVESNSTSTATCVSNVSNIIVIQPGSLYLRIGRSSDHSPLIINHCIARRHKQDSQIKSHFSYCNRRNKIIDKNNLEETRTKGYSFAENLLSSHHISNNDKRNGTSIKKHFDTNEEQKSNVREISTQKSPAQWTEVTNNNTFFIGQEALLLPPESPYNIFWPIRHGRLNLHDSINGSLSSVECDIFDIWLTVLEKKMNLTSNKRCECRAVLIIPDVFERQYIMTLINIILNQLKFEAIFVHQESVCSALGIGIISSCVVDVGDQKTSITCVDDGLAIKNSRITLDIGGSDITLIWYWLLKKIGLPWEANLNRYDHFLQLQLWKEQFCTLDADEEGSIYKHLHLMLPDFFIEKFHLMMGDERLIAPLSFFSPNLFGLTNLAFKMPSRQLKYSSDDPFDDAFILQSQIRGPGAGGDTKKVKKKINSDELDIMDMTPTIDDDDSCDVVETQSAHSLEISQNITSINSGPGRPPKPKINDDYDPIILNYLPSLPQAISESIKKCENDEIRKKMWSNIVLVGGGLLFSGATNFLQESLWPYLPTNLQIQQDSLEVLAHSKDVDSRLVAWKAATVLCCLDSAQELWITGDEWRLFGSKILREKAPFVW